MPPRCKRKYNDYKCPYCSRTFDSEEGVNRHISHMPACLEKQHEATSRILANYKSEHGDIRLDPCDRDEDLPEEFLNFFELQDTEGYLDNQFPNPPTAINDKAHSDGDSDSDAQGERSDSDTNEEAELLKAGTPLERKKAGPFVEQFSGAAEVLGHRRTAFGQRLAEENANGIRGVRLHDELHHELARWLMSSGLSQAKVDDFLKLKLVRDWPFLTYVSDPQPFLLRLVMQT